MNRIDQALIKVSIIPARLINSLITKNPRNPGLIKLDQQLINILLKSLSLPLGEIERECFWYHVLPKRKGSNDLTNDPHTLACLKKSFRRIVFCYSFNDT